MKKVNIVIQASSRSWSGGHDLCVNTMGDGVVLSNTLEAIAEVSNFSTERVYLIAPEFDSGGMDFLLDQFPYLKISYSHDSSPLLRMLSISDGMDDDDLILRINGINFCIDVDAANEIVGLGYSHNYDCIRFPDDFPALFSCDLYSVKGLRRMRSELNAVDAVYHVHPKYYMSATDGYSCSIYQPKQQKYTDLYLGLVRARYAESMHEKRIEVDGSKAIKSGDTITFHYELAKKYIKPHNVVLDMACGAGFGSQILASASKKVVGIDLDSDVISVAKATFATDSVEFMQCDALNLPFTNVFDVVVAFEIIEHISPNDFLKEVHKALKPNGLLCLSTPQNSLGRIPTTSDHIREYSLSDLLAIVQKYFDVEKAIGIKQGCIYFENDSVGSNTFLVAKKKMLA